MHGLRGLALPRGRRNPLMPAVDGKSMSVPQYGDPAAELSRAL